MLAKCPKYFNPEANGLCYYNIRYLSETPVNGLQKPFHVSSDGFSPKEISEILNTSGNYVNVILSKMRKKGKQEAKNEASSTEEINAFKNNSEAKDGQ